MILSVFVTSIGIFFIASKVERLEDKNVKQKRIDRSKAIRKIMNS